MTSRSPRALAAAAAALFLLVGAAGCGNDDTADTTTTTTEATTTTAGPSTTSAAEAAATVRFDKEIQSQLAAVGCYTGADDGVFGPETDAAIVAFQKASGLSPDGELGTQTEAALNKAVAEKKAVCGGTATTTTAKAGSTTTSTASPNGAPCTATALLGGLPAEGETIASYVCSGGYAAGSLTDGTKFILQAKNGTWYALGQDPCGSASAGLPPVILEDGC